MVSQAKEARTIHIFASLCDNDNQGIVPVPAKLGNGEDFNNNLYWGALYGVRTFFRNSKEWELVSTVNNVKEDTILQRCIFYHKTQNTYLIADAYKGDKIKKCITDFINSAHGNYTETISIVNSIDTLQFCIGGKANLIAYVGHDGLMEFSIKYQKTLDSSISRDGIILACFSKSFFADYIKNSSTNPLLWTTGLMAPEAYTLKSALDAWLNKESNEIVKQKSAEAYNKYQKCGLKASRRLFSTGF